MMMDYFKLVKMEEKVNELMKDKNYLKINDEVCIKRETKQYLKEGKTENVIYYETLHSIETYSMFTGGLTNSAYEAIMNYENNNNLIEIKLNKNAVELTFKNEDFIADFENDLNSYLKFKFNSKKNDIHILLYQSMDINLQVIMIKKLVEYYNSIVYKCDVCGNYEYKINKSEYTCSCGKKRCEECYKNGNIARKFYGRQIEINYCNDCYNNDDFIDDML